MLAKLDPEEPGSLTHNAAAACADCPVRGSCWVRTNLSLLRLPAVQEAIHELLWEATLGSDVHLSPRNLWDFLYQVTTGGLEIPAEDGRDQFLSCDWIQEELPASAKHLSAGQLSWCIAGSSTTCCSRPPQPDGPSRGPLLDALAAADPIRRGGKHTHLVEGEVRAAPKADAEALSTLALRATEPVPGAPGRPGKIPCSTALRAWPPILSSGTSTIAATCSGPCPGCLAARPRSQAFPPKFKPRSRILTAAPFLELLHELRVLAAPGTTAAGALSMTSGRASSSVASREIFGDRGSGQDVLPP